MKKNLILITLAFLLIAVTTTCNKDVQVTGIKLNEVSLTLEVDDTKTLMVTVLPENATNPSVVFTSSNPVVATVTSNGLVTARSKGVTIIAATTVDGNFSAKCTVQVDEYFMIEAVDIEYGKDNIAIVYAMVYGKDDEKIVATCDYQNNSFKLKLPNTVEDKYLRLFNDFMIFSNLVSDFDESWVSDKSAKVTFTWPNAWDVDKKHIGCFIYYYFGNYPSASTAQGFFLYADRTFTVKGEKIDNDGILHQCDCSFSKGWNFVYNYSDRDYHTPMSVNYYLFTTKKPSEGLWEWFFSSYGIGDKSSNTKHYFGIKEFKEMVRK